MKFSNWFEKINDDCIPNKTFARSNIAFVNQKTISYRNAIATMKYVRRNVRNESQNTPFSTSNECYKWWENIPYVFETQRWNRNFFSKIRINFTNRVVMRGMWWKQRVEKFLHCVFLHVNKQKCKQIEFFSPLQISISNINGGVFGELIRIKISKCFEIYVIVNIGH